MNLEGLRLRDFRQGQCIERIDAVGADCFRATEQPDLIDQICRDLDLYSSVASCMSAICTDATGRVDAQPGD